MTFCSKELPIRIDDTIIRGIDISNLIIENLIPKKEASKIVIGILVKAEDPMYVSTTLSLAPLLCNENATGKAT